MNNSGLNHWLLVAVFSLAYVKEIQWFWVLISRLLSPVMTVKINTDAHTSAVLLSRGLCSWERTDLEILWRKKWKFLKCPVLFYRWDKIWLDWFRRIQYSVAAEQSQAKLVINRSWILLFFATSLRLSDTTCLTSLCFWMTYKYHHLRDVFLSFGGN